MHCGYISSALGDNMVCVGDIFSALGEYHHCTEGMSSVRWGISWFVCVCVCGGGGGGGVIFSPLGVFHNNTDVPPMH